MEIVETSSTDQRIKDQSHEAPLDINELANSLREQLKIKKAFSATCCIYRVPERLRKLNAEAYTPRVVSIGPIHHGKENLKAMEDHKIMYLQQFLERSKVSLEGLCNVIKDNEKRLRDCYAETTGLNDAEFVTMILLDAVFIFMFLVKWKHMGFDSEDSRDLVEITDCSGDGCSDHCSGDGCSDQIFFPPWKLPDVNFDLCLLENQLPYFILEELYNLSPVCKKCTVIKLTGGLLERHCPEWVKKDSWKTFESSEILHFVDFLRKCQQHTSVRSPTATNRDCPEEQTENAEFQILGAAHNPTSRRHPVELSPILSVPTATNRDCPEEQTENGEFLIVGAAHNPLSLLVEPSGAAHNPTSWLDEPSGAAHNPTSRCLRDDASHNPTILCRLWNLIKLPWNSLCRTAHNQSGVPTASQLHQSGVKFKLPEDGKLCGIQFNKGILKIPQLEIQDGTEILFRNLQAFEQCHHLSKETFVSDYITFMNCLVRAPNDVEVLVQNEILKNMLSSNEAVSYLFHNLDKENIVTNRFLLGVCEDLNSYCSKRRHKWKATLKQEYFKNPWTGISVIAATFLLILTTVQTVCSILQL